MYASSIVGSNPAFPPARIMPEIGSKNRYRLEYMTDTEDAYRIGEVIEIDPAMGKYLVEFKYMSGCGVFREWFKAYPCKNCYL